MLLVQQDELRKFNDAWRMGVFEVLSHKDGVATRTGEWEVVLGRSKPDMVVSSKDTSAYRAFGSAMAKALMMQKQYDEKQKKSS